ncbi:MAG TPA: hypothetical protein VFO48_05490 [Vicinamibacterales bacterium]|nr:hypothetical protein [Vicinamibacterales bacterium]
MSDRRRTQRYVLGTPLTGDIMPMQDVVIERLEGTRVTVLSPSAHTADEDVMIHVSTSHGLESHRTKVISSTATSSGGSLQYRLELAVHGENDVEDHRR